MKIGVISDTHDQRLPILKAIEFFNREKVSLVIHCGDWVAPFTAARFRLLNCPLKGVFGNNDGDREMHRQRNSDFIEYHDDKMELEFDGRKIFVTHGHLGLLLDDALKSGKYDAIFSGHTHSSHVKNQGKTLWVNPGTLVDETTDVIKGMSVAIYKTETNTAEIIRLSFQQGEAVNAMRFFQ